jgi:hypothetical protein
MSRSGDLVPRFIIGGAPRSGTTFLCHAFERHPEVYIARPYIPEPKVFMTEAAGSADYRARYARFFADAPPRSALGEKTSYYLESAEACARIGETLEAVRLVFLVREPVARAYSNWLRTRKNGLEMLAFEEAVELEGRRPSPLPPEQAYARPFDYLVRGQYDVFAARYYERFGRDAVSFFVHEELEARPADVLRAIQRFIGVEPVDLGAESIGLVNSVAETGPPLARETELRLRERMAPAVRRFQALTGLDVSAWGYQ